MHILAIHLAPSLMFLALLFRRLDFLAQQEEFLAAEVDLEEALAEAEAEVGNNEILKLPGMTGQEKNKCKK